MIELIVVISIFLILTSITIFNYGQFRSSLSIQNLADDISLVVRKAQGYATGVQSLGDFTGSFGVHFTANTAQLPHYNGYNKQFILFFDLNQTPTTKNKYTYGNQPSCGNPVSGNECLEAFRIKSNDIIASIAYYEDGKLDYLNPAAILNIMFTRPKTEPFFCYQNSSIQPCIALDSSSYVEIKIQSISDETIYKYIQIHKNGQISVTQEPLNEN